MSASQAELFAEVERQFGFQPKVRKNEKPLDTMVRLMIVHICQRFVQPIKEARRNGHMKVTLQHWTLADLERLVPGHLRAEPRFVTGDPLVVVRVKGLDMLVDGANRRNLILRERTRKTYPVLLVEP